MDFSPQAVHILSKVGDVELRQCGREALKTALAEYDVVWFRLAHRIDQDILNGKTRCRVLATPVTGVDHIDVAACTRHGIRVVSLKGETEFLQKVRATAELTIGLALSLLRKIPAAVAAAREGVWNRDLFRGQELFGKTAGIVGMGRLGTIVAAYFTALGMRVIGFDPRHDYPHHAAARTGNLPELLAQADVVSLHVAYDDSTHHLIGRRELRQMKPGAILINTARGGVIDEAALVEALESGHLAGAALDVLDGEPEITASHPLVAYARSHENLLLTPHIGGNTAESFECTECFLAVRVVEAIGETAIR